MRNIFCTLSFLLISGLAGLIAQDGISGTPGIATKVGQVNLSEIQDDMMPILRNVSVISPAPGVEQDESDFLREKRRINEEMLENLQNGTPASSPRSITATPTQGVNFKANPYNNRVPNDNDLAVSTRHIVSVTNSIICIYDHNGRELQRNSLFALGGTADTIGGAFDPHVIFDHEQERFIVVYVNGSTGSNGIDQGYHNTIIAFSQTDDPTQTWNTYAINSTFLSDSTWMDYPLIAITDDELFITGNMFRFPRNPTRSRGGIVFQINLSDGYSGGNSLAYESYRLQNAFGLTPLEGLPDIIGPDMYFLSRSGTSNLIIYRINGTMNNPSTVLTTSTLRTRQQMSFPPDAPQPNSNNDINRLLETNSGGTIHGFRTKNNLYGVLTIGNSNRSAIYLFKVALSPLGPNFSQLKETIISSPDLFLAFPSVTPAGQSCDLGGGESAEDLFIGFNFSSPTKFPGNGAYYVSYKGEVSEPIILVEGLTNLDLSGNANDSRNRWGDYADVVSRGNLWEGFVTGYFAESNGDHTTWISQIEVSPDMDDWCPTVSVTDERKPAKPVKIYPNPAVDYMTFEFDIESSGTYRALIFDALGRQVEHLRTENLLPGTVRVGFNASALPAGQYQVRVEDTGNNSVLSKRFTVVK